MKSQKKFFFCPRKLKKPLSKGAQKYSISFHSCIKMAQNKRIHVPKQTKTVYKTGANIDGKKYIKSYELLKKHAKKFAWNIFKAKRFDDAKNVKSRHGYLSGPLCTEFFKFCPKIKRHFCLLLIGSPHFLKSFSQKFSLLFSKGVFFL